MPKKLTAGDRLRQYNEEFLKRVNALLDGVDVEYCMECNSPLCDCGEPHLDGTPSTDCQVCLLRQALGDIRKQMLVVNAAVGDFYGDSVKYPQLELPEYQQKQLKRIQAAMAKLMTL